MGESHSIMQSIYKAEGETLLAQYANQMVTSQLNQRAQTAITDRDICSKNVIELKSYFIGSLISRLSPDIEKTLSWVDGIAVNPDQPEASPVEAAEVQEIVTRLSAMQELLAEVQKFAALEAGISTDIPETLDINTIVRGAVDDFRSTRGTDGGEFSLQLTECPLPVLGYVDDLDQCFMNIFRYVDGHVQNGASIKVAIERFSEFEMSIKVRYPSAPISDVEIKRSLTSNNLVEHIIAIGADHPKMALPIAHALVELHSGKLNVDCTNNQVTELCVRFPVHTALSMASEAHLG